MPEMFGLQGSFYVCAAGGGRWPQVINIWDVGAKGWKGWAANVDRMNLKRRKAFYGDWWDEAAKWRTGGFDRLCGGVPGSPTHRGDRGGGRPGHAVRATRSSPCAPGSRSTSSPRSSRSACRSCASTATSRPASTRCSSNQHEVVMVWATDIPAQVRLRAEPRHDPRSVRRGRGRRADRRSGSARSAECVTGGDTHIMTPLPAHRVRAARLGGRVARRLAARLARRPRRWRDRRDRCRRGCRSASPGSVLRCGLAV